MLRKQRLQEGKSEEHRNEKSGRLRKEKRGPQNGIKQLEIQAETKRYEVETENRKIDCIFGKRKVGNARHSRQKC